MSYAYRWSYSANLDYLAADEENADDFIARLNSFKELVEQGYKYGWK